GHRSPPTVVCCCATTFPSSPRSTTYAAVPSGASSSDTSTLTSPSPFGALGPPTVDPGSPGESLIAPCTGASGGTMSIRHRWPVHRTAWICAARCSSTAEPAPSDTVITGMTHSWRLSPPWSYVTPSSNADAPGALAIVTVGSQAHG